MSVIHRYTVLRHRFSSLALSLLILMIPIPLNAQPDSQLSQVQAELRALLNRVDQLQNGDATDDEPFGKRVRAIGRQRKTPVVIEEDVLTVRFYDLSDVFSVAPQYPAQVATDFRNMSINIFPIASSGNAGLRGGGGLGGGGGGVFNVPPGTQQQPEPTSVSAARVSVNQLLKAIKTTVSPDDWEDTDGDATISVLGNTLLISATDTMHEQIANLLDLFREHWGKLKTVSVQVYWIRSNPAAIRDLMRDSADDRVVSKVDALKWQEFFQHATANQQVAYAATLSGQNGQTLHTVSGRQRLLVTDGVPIKSFSGRREEVEDDDVDYIDQSIAGIQPVRKLFQEGAAIQISPLATRGGNYVILDLHTRVNEVIDQEVDSVSHRFLARGRNGEEISLPLDNEQYVSYRLSTTVRCPEDEVVLAGGMTYDTRTPNTETDLYVFVATRIHAIVEDRSDREVKH